MPKSRKSHRNSRKKSYRSRLKDSKVNTAVERKIRQIAVREDAKNRQILTRSIALGAVTDDQPLQFQSSSYGFKALPQNGTADTNYQGLDSYCITKLAGESGTTGNIGADVTGPNNQYNQLWQYRLTKVQVFLQMINPDPVTPITVRVSLVEIPNANEYTAAEASASGITTVLRPNKQICGVRDMRCKGMFRDAYLNRNDLSNVKHRVLKSEQFRLNPPIASGGANADEGLRWKEINWSHIFKGRGRKYQYASAVQSADNEARMTDRNLYLVMAHNQIAGEGTVEPQVRGAIGCQYYLDKPNNQSVRFVT